MKCGAAPVRGGGAGACAKQFRRSPDGSEEILPNVGRLTLKAGETVVSMRTGGGGYGDPSTRDLARVAKDVAEGMVSVARAREVYKVAVDAAGRVDHAQTAALRAG